MALWTPADAAVQFWIDAADPATLFDATSGGSTPAGGGDVARAADKGSVGADVTQSTVAARPSRIIGAQGGLDALRFNGSSDFLTNSGYALESSRPGLTRFLVAQATSATSNFVSVQSASAGALLQLYLGDHYSYERGGVWGRSGGGTIAWHVYVAVYDGSQPATHADRIKLYRNGVHLAWSATSGTIGTTTGTGSGIDVGRPYGVNGAYWGGDIGECGAWASAFSQADRQQLEGYLAHRWGLSASLPADHPYKNSAPEYTPAAARASLRIQSRLPLKV